MHDIEFDGKHCILEHFYKWVKRIILHCYSIDRDIHLAHRVGPTIIAQKLRTVTAAHRFEENLRKMLNLLMNITQVWNTVRYLFLKRTCLIPHQ